MNATLVRAGVIVLTLGTALTHLQLNFPDPVFILNGLGYLGLLAALYLPLPIPFLEPYKPWVRWAMIGFTVLTIVLWLILGARTPLAYANKINELLLIGLLFLDGRMEQRKGTV